MTTITLTKEQRAAVIDEFLRESGEYLTNDASRQAACASAWREGALAAGVYLQALTEHWAHPTRIPHPTIASNPYA